MNDTRINTTNPNDMREVKPSLFALTAWWLSRHLILVGVIVAFILSLVGCQKAKAEEMAQNVKDYLYNYIDENYPNVSQSNLDGAFAYLETNVFNNYPHFALERCSAGGCCIVFMAEPDEVCFYARSYDSFSPTNPAFGYLGNTRGAFYLSWKDSGEIWVGYGSIASVQNTISNYNINRYSNSTSNLYGSSASITGRGVAVVSASYTPVSYLSCSRSSDYTPSYYQSTSHSVVEPVSYTEDSRLKFALINDTYEGEVLMTDIRQFMADFPIQDTSHSSAYLDPESITLKYTVDGTEKTITLDSSNSTVRSKYIFETPVYQFDFDDDNTSVIITNADFTITGTSQSSPYEASETYRIATNYPVRRLSPLPIPTPIPDPTYNDVSTDVEDPATVLQEITTQLVNNSTSTNAFTGEWTLDQEHPIVPSWADNYDFRVIKSDFNSIISGIVNKDIWNYYTTNDPDDYDWITGGFNPRNFVDENRNFAFYDMIIISVYEANIAWADGAVGTDLVYQNITLLGYITLYSQRYYVHKSAITDSNILAVLEYSSMNDVAFYETVKAQIDQFEEYTLGRLDAQLDIEKDSLAWLKTISSKIDEIEPYDDTSLLSSLNTIISKLDQLVSRNDNEDDTVSEAIAYYIAHNNNGKPTEQVFTDNKMSIWLAGKVHYWLQGSNANQDKTWILTDSFDVLTTIYDSMSGENGIVDDIRAFIQELSSPADDADELSLFFTDSFDPDTYEGVANE